MALRKGAVERVICGAWPLLNALKVAMFMEDSFKAASQKGSLAREVYQRIREVSLGLRQLKLVGESRWRGMDSGAVQVAIDDFNLVLFKENGLLDCSVMLEFYEGRWRQMTSWSSRATDPLELLSVWEHREFVRALEAL